ncbi:MAG TPA: ABC-2 family transporter protein [Candidatus Limnocylindrales bacterium]
MYRRSLGAHIRSILEYQADFWVLVLAGVLFQGLNLLFLSAVFNHVPTLNGWTYAESILLMGMWGMIGGLVPLFFEGMWGLAWRINQGELDYPLVRPLPVPAQVFSSAVGLHGFGDLIGGGAMLGWALFHIDVEWTPLTVLIGLVLFASAIAIHVSIVTITNAASFWIPGPHPFFAVTVHTFEDMIKYPLTIYGIGMRAVYTVVVPFAFVTFFPVSWLLGRDAGWVGLLTPLVAVYCVWMARLVFRAGLRRYESSGH